MLLCASVGCGYYIRPTPTIELAKYEKKFMYLISEQRRQRNTFHIRLVHIKRSAELESTPTWVFMSECQVYSFACLNFLRRILIEILDDLLFSFCRPEDVDVDSDAL